MTNALDQQITELAQEVIDLALSSETTISCAESCTGGMIAEALTRISGSSAVFLGGVVSYAISMKEGVLKVPDSLIEAYGVVSEEVARAMAKGACHVTETHLAVSTTGIAGPGGAEPGKPVGTVCFGLAMGDSVAFSKKILFDGDRQVVRQKATLQALSMLKDALI